MKIAALALAALCLCGCASSTKTDNAAAKPAACATEGSCSAGEKKACCEAQAAQKECCQKEAAKAATAK